MKIEFNKTYPFDIPTDTFSWCDLTKEELIELFQDGRVASWFFERQIPKWFPELTYINTKGYDHVDEQGNKYDAKGFTKNGCGFMPSKMKGVGRTFDAKSAHAHADEISYIIHDIREFPSVNLIFKKGSDLTKEFPNCKISNNTKDVHKLFNGQGK